MEMPIHRPVPRRPFDITPASADSSRPSSPPLEPNSPELLGSRNELSPTKTRSILNLTSSTLFGIYSGTSDSGNLESSAPTPWGTGAQTPSQRKSLDGYTPEEPQITWSGGGQPRSVNKPRLQRAGLRGYYIPLALQTALLFAFGTGYGSIVTHLHKTQQITPVPLPSVDRNANYYLLAWGLFGIVVGNGLPIVDEWLDDTEEQESVQRSGHKRSNSGSSDHGRDDSLGPIWYSAVRSVGAFVGIAFAVVSEIPSMMAQVLTRMQRKLPWQSTLQVSSTLALANPVLWYMIDRSMPGFAFSTTLATVGTVLLALMNPNFVPVPAIHQAVASEQVGVYMWLASILFCSTLCFGAIGRKLQL